MRKYQRVRAAMRYFSQNAGSTIYACSILILKPMPTRSAPTSSQRNLPRSMAMLTAHAAKSDVKTSWLSIVLLRFAATLMGVTASTSAATSPAPAPNTRATR